MNLASLGRRVAELPGIWYCLGAFIRWSFRQFSQHEVHGFAILIDGRHSAVVDVLRRLEATLKLLEQADPRRYKRIVAAVPRIMVGELLPNRAYSVEYGPAIVIDRQTILLEPLAMLASTVVHEGSHARFSRRGIRYTRQRRARIEHRCCAEQMDFLRRLPSEHATDAQRIVMNIEAALASPTPWYLQAEIDRNKKLARQRRSALRAAREAPES